MALRQPLDDSTLDEPQRATYDELERENARLRQRAALAERETTALWRATTNGYVLPQDRSVAVGALRALYEQRDGADLDTFTVDYYQGALRAGMFQHPRSDDSSERRSETEKAKVKFGRAIALLHEWGFLTRGRVMRTTETYLDERGRTRRKVTTDGVEITLRGSLIQALHRLGEYDGEIPVRKARGLQGVRIRCSHCGSENVSYDCMNCGAVDRPSGELEVVRVPLPVSQILQVSDRESVSQNMRDREAAGE